MNIGQVFQKLKDMIAAFRGGNTLAAALIAWEIVQAILNSYPASQVGKPQPMHASATPGFDVKTATEDELIDELERLSVQPMHATAMSAPPTGPFIAMILPILLALFKIWFPF